MQLVRCEIRHWIRRSICYGETGWNVEGDFGMLTPVEAITIIQHLRKRNNQVSTAGFNDFLKTVNQHFIPWRGEKAEGLNFVIMCGQSGKVAISTMAANCATVLHLWV